MQGKKNMRIIEGGWKAVVDRSRVFRDGIKVCELNLALKDKRVYPDNGGIK